MATLCASVILVNPIAKLAITMDPVGVAANTWAAGVIQGAFHVPHLWDEVERCKWDGRTLRIAEQTHRLMLFRLALLGAHSSWLPPMMCPSSGYLHLLRYI